MHPRSMLKLKCIQVPCGYCTPHFACHWSGVDTIQMLENHTMHGITKLDLGGFTAACSGVGNRRPDPIGRPADPILKLGCSEPLLRIVRLACLNMTGPTHHTTEQRLQVIQSRQMLMLLPPPPLANSRNLLDDFLWMPLNSTVLSAGAKSPGWSWAGVVQTSQYITWVCLL